MGKILNFEGLFLIICFTLFLITEIFEPRQTEIGEMINFSIHMTIKC